MSEDQSEYTVQQDEINDALEMLGKGYETSVEIEHEQTIIQRRNGKLEAIEKSAFIKLLTAFKQELPAISGDALKVWIFIVLSINRKTGTANPGLRTIAAGVKLAVNTVQKCLAELEDLSLLVVDRKTARYNIYESPEYVSANRSDPTVSNGDTPAETVSNCSETVSNDAETVSPLMILNQINQSEPEIGADAPSDNLPIDWKIAKGQKITEKDLQAETDRKMHDAADLISVGFGIYTPAAYNLAYAFQVARQIVIPTDKVKGQRKAVKEMLEAKPNAVFPAHVVQAVKDLTAKNMTVTDLYSVSKTAIALANPAPVEEKPKSADFQKPPTHDARGTIESY